MELNLREGEENKKCEAFENGRRCLKRAVARFQPLESARDGRILSAGKSFRVCREHLDFFEMFEDEGKKEE